MAENSTAAVIAVRAAFPALTALPHVVQLVDQYLDQSVRFSLADASARGRVLLLERVASRSLELLPSSTASDNERQRAFLRTLSEAARGGHVDAVEWLFRRFSRVLDVENDEFSSIITYVTTQASRRGHLPVMQWLHEHASGYIRWTTKMAVVAAIEGHFQVVRWLHEHSTAEDSTYVMDSAADHGDLDMLQWLKTNSTVGCSPYAMDNAARRGNLEVVQWLHENCQEGCTVGAMDSAATEGHLHVLKWLHEHRHEGCSHSALPYAAMFGHTSVVQWLLRHREEGDQHRAFEAAVQWNYPDTAHVLGEHLGMSMEQVDAALEDQETR